MKILVSLNTNVTETVHVDIPTVENLDYILEKKRFLNATWNGRDTRINLGNVIGITVLEDDE